MSAPVTLDISALRARPWIRPLALDLVLFAGLLMLVIAARIASPVWPRVFHFPSTLMTVAMAMFGIAASAVMAPALRSVRAGDVKMAQRMIAIAVAMLGTMVLLLGLEWARLYFFEEVHLLSNPVGVPALGLAYYGLTAYFAAHAVLTAGALIAASQRPEPNRLERLSWLVHLTNAMFVLLAPVMILSAADLKGF